LLIKLFKIWILLALVCSSHAQAVDFGQRVENQDFQDVVGIALFDELAQEAKIFCSGVLIHPRFILTAAHCLQEGSIRQSAQEVKELTKRLRIVVGEGVEGGYVSENLITVKRGLIHPRYLRDIRGQADVAILELSQDASISAQEIRPLALDLLQLRHRIRRQAKLTVVGLGYAQQIESRFRTTESFGLKHQGEIEIIGKTADELYVTAGPAVDRFGLYRQAPRQGDSGGPVFFLDEDGQYYLAGLVSRATQFNHGPRGAALSLLRNWVCWIESETGISLRQHLKEGVDFCDIQVPRTQVEHLKGVSFIDQCENTTAIPSSALYTIEVLQQLTQKNDCQDLFQHLQRQTNLSLDSTYINDLSPLQEFTQLERLSLRDNAITSITPLINLDRLRTLDISYNLINDVTHVQPRLPEELWLIGAGRQYNSINQTQFIRLCHQLDLPKETQKTIDALLRLLGANPGECVNANYELIRRRGIEFYQSQDLTDMSPLTGLQTLEELDLTGQNVSDLSFLNEMSELRVLILDGNPVKDLSPLLSHPNLRVLSVQNMNLKNLDYINQLPRLRELSVHGNEIQDFSDFAERERRGIIRLHGKDQQH
jgi:internalin A